MERPKVLDFEGAWLFNYGIAIHLVQSEDHHKLPSPLSADHLDPQDNHISFQCEDVEGIEEKLKENGVKYKKMKMKTEDGIEMDQIFFNDPDGFMVEVCNSRGAMENGDIPENANGGGCPNQRDPVMIKQFLKDVHRGELDSLVVDAPPVTSYEHITIVQCLESTRIDGAIIVTTPQQVSLVDVRKEVNFCKKVGVKVLGVVENMSGLRQPITDLKFMKMTKYRGSDRCVRVRKMCNEMGLPFLGKVPLDPRLCKATEKGQSCFVDKDSGVSASALKKIIEKLMESNGLSTSPNSVA
ncbi:cytosolic Fe-S cluster assembly factor NBP35-like [Senna tora]|uniref:Cytosolic Fe-S cluster assembly factor NBP35-like n=1 Tax=Senna tora TaxID=362788 RepID=A0A834TPJ4_9FABA|nr:cytosolic Fe-S cluster assembly factor NBP35-like [Senna tora]